MESAALVSFFIGVVFSASVAIISFLVILHYSKAHIMESDHSKSMHYVLRLLILLVLIAISVLLTYRQYLFIDVRDVVVMIWRAL